MDRACRHGYLHDCQQCCQEASQRSRAVAQHYERALKRERVAKHAAAVAKPGQLLVMTKQGWAWQDPPPNSATIDPMSQDQDPTSCSEAPLPALEDVPGHARWLLEMREHRRAYLSIDEWELIGQAVLALQQLAVSARPSTLKLDPGPLALHDGLHRIANANQRLTLSEHAQLRHAALILWGFANGLTAHKLARRRGIPSQPREAPGARWPKPPREAPR